MNRECCGDSSQKEYRAKVFAEVLQKLDVLIQSVGLLQEGESASQSDTSVALGICYANSFNSIVMQ